MIKVVVTEEFTIKRFNELKNIERYSSKNQEGRLYVGDTFECDEEMVKYLTGGNEEGANVVRVIEVEPKMPTIIGHRVDDVEYVIPLGDKEKLDKLNKAIEKAIKSKKEKSSKK